MSAGGEGWRGRAGEEWEGCIMAIGGIEPLPAAVSSDWLLNRPDHIIRVIASRVRISLIKLCSYRLKIRLFTSNT